MARGPCDLRGIAELTTPSQPGENRQRRLTGPGYPGLTAKTSVFRRKVEQGGGTGTRTFSVTLSTPLLPKGGRMSTPGPAPDTVDHLNDELTEVRELLREFNADVDQLIEREAA